MMDREVCPCDSVTPVNLAQHSYFNLRGHDSGAAVMDHRVRLHAAEYTPVDDTLIPTGDTAATAGTPFDLYGDVDGKGSGFWVLGLGRALHWLVCIDVFFFFDRNVMVVAIACHRPRASAVTVTEIVHRELNRVVCSEWWCGNNGERRCVYE